MLKNNDLQSKHFRGDFLVSNGALIKCSNFEFEKLSKQPFVYEVIRVISSVPLFLEDHFERFERSIRIAAISNPFLFSEINATLQLLINSNSIENGNIKIVYPALSKTSTSGLTAFFIPHKYPDSEQYRKGVEIVTLIQSRPNPNAKISNPDLRKQADEIIANRNVFEVLLIEESGIITECSRANIFFIKQDQIITSPESLILKGITREYIFKICNQNGISLKEKIIHQSNLQHVNATFITGTSPKVLPVCKIDEYSYTTDNPLLLKVMELYNKEIDKYILKRKVQ
ncbi:MAG TPA: aminotransferase class IV [Bacteroidales bacterium]|nr:aminotransferase class IV [Bacteroidales bacterium]